MVSATTINGGTQHVSGGVVSTTTINKNGTQIISGGTVISSVIKNGGSVCFAGGGAEKLTAAYGAHIYAYDSDADAFSELGKIAKGGSLSKVTFSTNILVLNTGAKATNYELLGEANTQGGAANKIIVSSGANFIINEGSVSNTTVQQNGTLTFKSTTAKASKITVLAGGLLVDADSNSLVTVNGKITAADYKDEKLTFGKGAVGSDCVFCKDALVTSGAKLIAPTVDAGTLTISKNAQVSNITINNTAVVSVDTKAKVNGAKLADESATLQILSGGIASNVTLNNGSLNLATGGNLFGITFGNGNLVLNGGTLSGVDALTSLNAAHITGTGNWLVKKTLTLGATDAATDLTNCHLNVSCAKLDLAGSVTIGSLAGKVTNITGFNIQDIAPDTDTETYAKLLTAAQNASTLKGNVQIVADTKQTLGSYTLSENVTYAGKFTVQLGKKSISGNIGRIVSKEGVSYSLNDSGQLSLTAYASKNTIIKGKKASNALTGTNHSDVFYGCGQYKDKGTNDTITTMAGRDIVVYDANSWGTDKIKTAKGTLTLLFKDMTSDDFEITDDGTTKTFTNKADNSQTITVQDWNDSTHTYLYGNSMMQFATWAATSTPTTSETLAARNEVWQKAGLTSA